MDYIVEQLKKDHIPLTRENYLELAYLGNPPKQLQAEQEAELPEEIQEKPNESEESEA